MSVQTRDGIVLVVALFAMAGFVYYYIGAVVDQDRTLSWVTALLIVVFGVAAVVMAWRILT